jgi:hypothetical protein
MSEKTDMIRVHITMALICPGESVFAARTVSNSLVMMPGYGGSGGGGGGG